MVVAQAIATVAISLVGLAAFRRFPAAPARPLGDDRREVISFTLASSVGTGVVSLRTTLVPLVLGIVAGPTQVGLFRIAQTPQTGLSAASSPARLVLLTDQTRAWERGRQTSVLAGVRAYTLVAAGLMIVAVPVFLLAMPWLVETVFGSEYSGAVDAARIILVAAAIQFALGWSKSLPVTIGRPRLRIVTHGLEALVVIPLVAVLGSEWGATGAAVAVLVATLVFARRLGGGDRAPAGRCRRARIRGRRGRRREGADRLRDLAARRRRAGESRARARRLPARPRALGRGRDDRRRPAREAGVRGSLGRSSGPRGRATCARRGLDQRAGDPRRRRLRDEHARASRRSARRSRADRSSSSSSRTRPTSGRGAGGSSTATSTPSSAFGGGLRVRPLRQARDRALRRVAHLVCPSAYLAALAVGWGVPRERVTVLPNAAPALPSLPDRDEARAALGVEGPCSRSPGGSRSRRRSRSLSTRSLGSRM